MIEHFLDLAAVPGDQQADPTSHPQVTFVGNATVLLRLGGFTVLTDPNFLHAGAHAKLGGGLRSLRLLEPALQPADLPPLDLIVLSHHHGDHFDEVAIRELDKQVPILTTPGAARKLRRQGFVRPFPLGTGDSCTVTRNGRQLRVTALPATHGPRLLGAVLPQVMGSLLELPGDGRQGFRLYITGDTVLHDDLRAIAERYPDIDCALLHLGGTRVLGVLLSMDAAQGVELLRLVRPRHAVPIHTDDYTVQRSPLTAFTDAAVEADLPTTITVLPRGAQVPLPG